MTAVYDAEGRFQGHEPNEGCVHRTVGSHRAWCFNCNEWCHPDLDLGMACVRCERAHVSDLIRRLADALAAWEKWRTDECDSPVMNWTSCPVPDYRELVVEADKWLS